MNFFLITYIILFPFVGETQDSVPESDLVASQRLLKDFISYDSNYLQERAAAATRTKALAAKVFELEKKGYNTSCMHQVFFEAGSLLYSSADFKKINERLNTLESAIGHPDNLPDADVKDSNDGSYGKCYNEWYLKVDKSYDQLEKNAKSNSLPIPLPGFLDGIRSPLKLEKYFTSISVSNVSKTGIDNEREFNDMLATLMQMIIRGRPENYIVDSSPKKNIS
jgi:hypothetical protein